MRRSIRNKNKISDLSITDQAVLAPVSYTHLDVYKRQELE